MSIVIPRWFLVNSHKIWITVLSFLLSSPAIFFFKKRVRPWLSKCPQQQPRIQSWYRGRAAVQSRLAGYLMSLVIGLLWPPCIPALLLLMCAGTERAMAWAPSLVQSSLSVSRLNPSVLFSFNLSSTSWYKELMLHQTSPCQFSSIKTFCVLHVVSTIIILEYQQHYSISLSPGSVWLGYYLLHTLTHISLLDASCIMQNMWIQTSNLQNFQLTTSEW